MEDDIEEDIAAEGESEMQTLGETWASAAQQLANEQLQQAAKICNSLRAQLQRERRLLAAAKHEAAEKTQALASTNSELERVREELSTTQKQLGATEAEKAQLRAELTAAAAHCVHLDMEHKAAEAAELAAHNKVVEERDAAAGALTVALEEEKALRQAVEAREAKVTEEQREHIEQLEQSLAQALHSIIVASGAWVAAEHEAQL